MALPGPLQGRRRPGCRRRAQPQLRALHLIHFLVQTHLTGFVITIEWVDEDGTIRRFTAFPQGRATHTNPSTGESVTFVGRVRDLCAELAA